MSHQPQLNASGSLYQQRKGERGVTLIETSIVVGILLLIIVAGLRLAPTVFNKMKVSKETSNLISLSTNINSVFQSNFTNVTNANLLTMQLVPSDFNVAGAIVGTWGPITVASSTLTGGTLGYSITETNIPSKVCPGLATALAAYFDELSVNGTVVQSLSNASTSLDAASVATPCSGAATIVVKKTQ